MRGLDQVALGKARHALAKALELDGQRDAAIANMGVLARVAGEFEEAERYLKLALGLDPGYGAYMNNLGNVYAAQGKLKLAESWYQKALSKDPTNLRAKANRALSLTLRKKKKAAIALWRELEDEPRFAKQAHDQLVALGAKSPGTKPAPKDSPAAPSASAFVTTGRGPESKEVEVKLGGSLSELVELLGEPDHRAAKGEGFTQVLFWRTLGVAVVFEDDEAFNVLVRSPARLDLGGQLGLGATGAEVEAAFGAPQEKISKLGGRHEEWVYGPSLQLAVDGAKLVVLGAQLALE